MKIRNYLVLALFAFSTALVSCNNDDDNTNDNKDDEWTEGNGTTEDGDGTLDQESAIVVSANDFAAKSESTFNVAPLTYGLNYVVKVPLQESTSYQATDVAVYGKKMYVAFGEKDEGVSGGIAYVPDYSASETAVNYLTNDEYEITSLAFSNDGEYLYAGGAAKDYNEHAAILFVFDVSKGAASPISKLELNSRVVKDIVVGKNDEVYVATGDDGGVLKLDVTVADGAADIVVSSSDALRDARSIGTSLIGQNATDLFALSASSFTTYAEGNLDNETANAVKMDEGSETETAGAQRIMGFYGATPILAMGVSGIQDASGDVLANRYISSSVNTSGDNYADYEYAVNAVTSSGHYLVAAEGASGVVIRKVGSIPSSTVSTLTANDITLQGALNLSGSANNVKITDQGDYVFVAAGEDGVRVLETIPPSPAIEKIVYDKETGTSTFDATYDGYFSSINNVNVADASAWNGGYLHVGGLITANADFTLAAESKITNLTVNKGTTAINTTDLTLLNNVKVNEGGTLAINKDAYLGSNLVAEGGEIIFSVEGANLTVAEGVTATIFNAENVGTASASLSQNETTKTPSTITIGKNATFTINSVTDLYKSTLVLEEGAKLVVKGDFNWISAPTINVNGAGASIVVSGNVDTRASALINVAAGVTDFKVTAASESGNEPIVEGGMNDWDDVYTAAE
ncbi:MAG: hypothetical protein ACK5JS_02060 [Mangrovibacterium sp.]